MVSAVLPEDTGSKKTKKPQDMTKKEREKFLKTLEKSMRDAARKLEFEEAARLRDIIMEIRAGN